MVVRGVDHPGEFRVTVGRYVLGCVPDGLPPLIHEYVAHAELVDRIALDDDEARCALTVTRVGEPWPFVVVAQGFEPAGGGFEPGLLVVEDTERLFLGAGRRLLIYDLAAPRRLARDELTVGFRGWERYGDVVLMSAEVELRAYDALGALRWSRPVEPPWFYRVEGEAIFVDVMGEGAPLHLDTGAPFGTEET